MIDRLALLRKMAIEKGTPGINSFDQELGTRQPSFDGEFMDDFFSGIEHVKKKLNEIYEKLDEMKILKDDALNAVSTEKEQEISQKLEEILMFINKSNLKTKELLQRLREENETMEGKGAELSIRKNMVNSMMKRFADCLTDCQKAQVEYRQQLKAKATRQIRMVYPDASEEDINQLVEDEGGATLAIKTKMAGGHEALQDALADIYDKYRDVKRLEASVKELHQMFVELATLVDRQGELIDCIENNVETAVEHTEKAEKELVVARKWQVTAKKYMCCIIVVLIAILLIVLLPIFLTRRN